MTAGPGHTVVNGRFLTMQQTGVQRYARRLLAHLPAHVDGEVLVAVPPDTLVDAADGEALDAVGPSGRWHGSRGHAWEQLVLPRLWRRAGAGAVLLSPASWGPAAVRRQVPIIHDIAPQLHPEMFTIGYRAMSSSLTPVLLRRCARIGATCANVAGDIVSRYGVDPGRIDVVPPGVGPPFDRWPGAEATPAPTAAPATHYCVMVGAHDRRKNVAWVAGWWPAVHHELGLELVVTTRGRTTTRFSDDIGTVPGLSVRVNPDDDELCGLYAGAMCLLWPSRYEGYGLPLLEAMAVGTPFLATDTGAARELAIEDCQVLPLEAGRWIDQLRRWCSEGTAALRAASRDRARARSWDATAAAAAQALAAARAGPT